MKKKEYITPTVDQLEISSLSLLCLSSQIVVNPQDDDYIGEGGEGDPASEALGKQEYDGYEW
ncbi:MAG: hypothetical protein Q3994_03855 [Prevotella sp.]|nr:hypothetical protein [Prevotella sp.]